MRSRGAVFMVVLALLVTAGCGSSGDDDDGSDDAAGKAGSDTPAVSTKADGPLSGALLTSTDMEALPALGKVEIAAIDAAQVYEDPDPRGPCGASVLPFPKVDAVGRSFTGADRQLFQIVAADPAAGQLMTERLADIHEPCGPYESKTNTGEIQLVHDIQVARVDGVEGYASTAVIDSEGQSAHVIAAVAQSGDRLSFVLGIAPQATELADAQALLRRIADRIDR